MRKFTIGLLLTLLSMVMFSQNKVVGYFPYYGDESRIQWDKITDIVYGFGIVSTSGDITIQNSDKFETIVNLAKSNGVRIILACGGADQSGNFSTLAASSSARTNFANDISAFDTQYGLDGFDLDWEFPSSGEANNVTYLLQAVRAKMGDDFEISIAVAPYGTYNTGGINENSTTIADFVNIMAYDDPAPSHSTYAMAQQAITFWHDTKNVPSEKLRLGVPFYGKKTATNTKTYFDIISEGGSETSDSYNGYGYNGQTTITSKANLVLSEGLDGIMIWEISQDYTTDKSKSLSKAIDDVLKSGVSCANPDLGFTKSLCDQPSVVLDAGVNGGNDFSYKWKRNNSYISGATEQTYTATQTGDYTVEYSHTGNCPTKTSEVEVISTVAIEVLDGERCEEGTVDLEVITGGTYKWFSVSTGGTSLHTGQQYTTPSISSSTTYYVEKPAVSEIGGKLYANGTGGDFSTGDWTPTFSNDPTNGKYARLNFDVLTDFTLDFITTYSGAAQDLVITIYNESGGVVGEVTRTVAIGKVRIPVDIDISEGENYQIGIGTGVVWLEDRGEGGDVGFPFFTQGVINLKSTETKWGAVGNWYLGLYDWEISAGGSCGGRVPVEATINTNCTPPTISNIVPSNNTTVTDFSPVDISATVVDPDNAGITSVEINVYELGVETPVHTETATNSGDVFSGAWTPSEFAVYTIEFVATDANSNTSTSSVKFTIEDPTSPPTGFESISSKNAIEVFPNPASNIIHVKGNSSFEYIITDMKGIELMNGSTESEINIVNLESGLYILQIQTDGEVKTTSFMKK